MKVSFYQRKPRSNRNFSIENYFNAMRSALPASIEQEICICKYESSGFFRRLYNSLEAIWKQGDVNHITGDINYLTYFLKRHKTILTVHDLSRLLYLKGIRLSIFKYLWFVLPAKKSRYITTISTATKNHLLKHISFDPEKLIASVRGRVGLF